MPKFEKKPEIVEAFRTRGDRFVDTVDGPKKARPGQWIVVVGDGKYAIVEDEKFREEYVAKDKDAKVQLKSGGPQPDAEPEAPKGKGVLGKLKDAVTGGGDEEESTQEKEGEDSESEEEDGEDK